MREQSVNDRRRAGHPEQRGRTEASRPQPQPKKKKPRRFYDYSLLFTIIFLTVFGLVMIYSSSSYNAQVLGQGHGLLYETAGIHSSGRLCGHAGHFQDGLPLFCEIYRSGHRGILYLYVSGEFHQPGDQGQRTEAVAGSRPVRFQPTELVKVTVILVLAVVITRLGKKIDEWRSWGMLIVLIAPLALMVMANNLSSGLIIMGIGFVMMFIACKKKWIFILSMALGAAVFIFAPMIAMGLEKAGILESYQLSRILVWKNPEAYPRDGGYQVLQGLYAIGSGGLLGKGLGQSIQKLSFLPEPQNDMIFAIICEELGLFGAISVILIFLFMIYRFMLIAGNAPDLFGALLVVGVMAHIAIQVILNIAVVTNVIPNTGITLPFISYGGTSVLFLMVEMGMALSVSNQIKLER